MDGAATPLPFDLYVAADVFLKTGRGEGEVLPRLGIAPARWAVVSQAYFQLLLGDDRVGGIAALWPDLSRDELEAALIGPRWRFPGPRASLAAVARGLRALVLAKPHVGPFADADWAAIHLCDHAVATLLFYSRDATTVYFAGERLVDARGAALDIDAAAFRHLGGRWFTDGGRILGQGERGRGSQRHWWTLEGAEPTSFQVLNQRYAKDAFQAWYITGQRIGTRSPAAFAIVPDLRVNWRTGESRPEADGSQVARDARHVYSFGARMRNADPARFRALGADYWTDDRRVWTDRGKRAVVGAEATSFHVVSPSDPPLEPGFGDATGPPDSLPPGRAGVAARRPSRLDGLLQRTGGSRSMVVGTHRTRSPCEDASTCGDRHRTVGARPNTRSAPSRSPAAGVTPLARARLRRDNRPCTPRPCPLTNPPRSRCGAAGRPGLALRPARARRPRRCSPAPARPASPIPLPSGARPVFAVARETSGEGWAEAGIVKDAGDDPDVTHGAMVIARVALGQACGGLRFVAGEGGGHGHAPPACRCRRASRRSIPGPAR